MVPSLIESAIITLEAMKTSPGPLLKDFLKEAITSPTFCGHDIRMEEQEEFKNMMGEFIDAVVNNLRARFPSTDVVLAMSILDPIVICPLKVDYTTMAMSPFLFFAALWYR